METEILTKEHIEAGKSRNGGWSYAQFDLLNVNHKVKGWKHRAIGNRYPKSVIEKFIALKDAHLPPITETPKHQIRKAKKSKTVVSQREKDYRSADWKSEQDRLRHFDYLTEGI